MAQQARDEAGNIWELDAQGNAVRLVQPAGTRAPMTVAAPAYRAQQQQRDEGRKDTSIDLDRARLGLSQNQDNRNAATQPYDVRNAAATATKAEDTARNVASDRQFDRAKALRADYEALPSVKTYTAALPVYGAGLRSGADAAGDLNLIYAYAKVMDPNSVVREGEQASVAGGDTWINQKTAELQKQLGQGGTFKPEFRKRLREEMSGRMGEMNQLYIADRVKYKHIADRNGVDIRDVVGEHPGARYQALSQQVLGKKPMQLDYDGMPIATGATKIERDPRRTATLNAMIRGGADIATINATMEGMGGTAVNPAEIEAARAYLRKNPGYKGSLAEATNTTETSLLNRVAASPTGTAIGAAADAGLGGTADELSGLIQSAVNGKPVAENISSLNAAKNAAFAANPKSAMAGQIGGSIAAMLGVGKVAEGIPLVQGLANPGLAADLAFGTASGAGQNNDNRLTGAAAGAAGSAVGNVAGALIAKPIGALARSAPGIKSVNVARELIGKIPGVEARAPIQGVAAPAAAEQAVLSTAERAGIPKITGQLADAQAQNLPLSLADTAPSLAELGGAATRRSPVARDLAEKVLLPRSRGQVERLGSAVERELGPIGNTLQISDNLAAKAQIDAAPLYEQAYATPVPSTPEIASLLQTPFGRQAVGRARTIAANERRAPEELGFALDESGQPVLNPQPNNLIARHLVARSELDDAQAAYRAARSEPGSMDAARLRVERARENLRAADGELSAAPDPTQIASVPAYTTQTLDYVKRGMDNVLEQYRNPVTNRLVLDEAGKAENGVKVQLLSEVDRLNNPFKQARAAYQGPMEARDALNRGQDFYGSQVDANQIAAVVPEQTPEHLAQMQLGYRDQMMGQANDLQYNTNPWRILNSPGAEAKLSAMYPDSAGPANLFTARDAEMQMASTANRMIGGSPTAPRMIADQQFLPAAGAAAAIDGVTAATGGVPLASVARLLASSKVGDALRLGVGKKAEAKAEAMIPLLLNTDPAAAKVIIDDLVKKGAAYGAFKKATTPTRSFGRAGSATGQNEATGYVRK